MRAMRRWHRRIGAVIAVVVLLVAITGIALNHSVGLQLGKRTLNHPLIFAIYGIELPEPTAFAAGGQWLSHWGGNYLYLQDKEIGYCEPPLSGAVLWRGQIIVACADAVLQLTQEGEFIERLGEHYDLPWPVTGLAINNGLILITPEAQYRADLDQLQWTLLNEAVAEPVAPQPLPENLINQLRPRLASSDITLERVVADLHSGRILGRFGVWLADLAALGLVFLAGSGLWLWWQRRG